MKRAVIFSSLAIMACAASAHAEVEHWTAPYNWQGVYVGVNAGVGWGSDKSKESITGGGPTGFEADYDQRGGVEGIQIGYNVPLGQHVIFGADADWDNYDVSGGYRRLSNGNGDDVRYDWMASLRARIGTPIDNILPYIDGGFAFGNIRDTYIQGNAASQDMTNVRFGWTVGAGLEYGLPENFTARIDYRYINFASYNQSPSNVLPGFTYKQDAQVNLVTAGISYYFK